MTDSRSAIQLGNESQEVSLARIVANTYRDLEDTERTVVLQWMPSDVGIPDNESVDILASAAHHDDTPTLFLQRFSEVKRLIETMVNLRHAGERIARRYASSTIFHLYLPRPDCSLVHRTVGALTVHFHFRHSSGLMVRGNQTGHLQYRRGRQPAALRVSRVPQRVQRTHNYSSREAGRPYLS